MTNYKKDYNELAELTQREYASQLVRETTTKRVNPAVRKLDMRVVNQRVQKVSEHGEQVAVIQWAQLQSGRWPQLRWLHAIPNGGHRGGATGARLKAEGVKPGVPDLFLPVPRGGYSGLYIEMKVKPNKPTLAQAEWIDAMNEFGYSAWICYSADEAIAAITDYMQR
jgi:hypothetical protein